MKNKIKHYFNIAFSGSTKRLTYAHKGGQCLSDDPLAAGVPSYVMQEEFNRYHGYWWQPKKLKGKYLLIFVHYCNSKSYLSTAVLNLWLVIYVGGPRQP